jgi:MazG family protein
MEKLDRLLEVADTLLGPNGCPWDLQQTLQSLQPYLLEEAHELIESIDLKDPVKMREELGDVFYTLIFIAKLGEKEGFFTLSESLESITEKLIRRHPHIFSDCKVEGADEVMRNWEAIKKKEGRKTLFEGIPPTLPSLSRAQKMIAKLLRVSSLKWPRALEWI